MNKNLKDTKFDYVDYKDVDTLKKFLTTHARIQGKKRTEVPAKAQRAVKEAVKRARHMGFLPYISR